MRDTIFFRDRVEETTACGPEGMIVTATFLPLGVSFQWNAAELDRERAYLALADRIGEAVLQDGSRASSLLAGCEGELVARVARIAARWRTCDPTDLTDLTWMIGGHCLEAALLGIHILRKRGLPLPPEAYQDGRILRDRVLRRMILSPG